MATKGMTVESLMAWFAKEVGYREGSGYGGRSNYTKYWAALKPEWQGSPWCATFVNAGFAAFGNTLLLDNVPSPYYTPSMEAWAKKVGRWDITKNGNPGDVVIMGNSRGATHTGILVGQYDANNIITIEGNTSSGNKGSQTNGDGVWRRVRPRSFCRGIIKMQDQFDRPQAFKAGKKLEITGALDEATVKALQTQLNRWKKSSQASLVVDGDLGYRIPARDRKTVKQLQWQIATPADGDFGPASARALEKWLNVMGVPTRVESVPGWYPQLIRNLQTVLNREMDKW